MEKAQVLKALEELKKEKKRNFVQSYDLIINLKELDIKTNPVDAFFILPHSRGKKVKICGLIGSELGDKAEKAFNFSIKEKDFALYKEDKKKTKKLAREYDFFVAQANLMAQIASVFGRALGPKGRMPNPKAGCIVPPNADLNLVAEKLQKTVQVKAKNAPVVQCIIGSEEMQDEQVVENVLAVYNQLVKLLPAEGNNVANVCLKKTMSKVIKV